RGLSRSIVWSTLEDNAVSIPIGMYTTGKNHGLHKKGVEHASRKGESAQGPLGRREGINRRLDSDSSHQHTQSTRRRQESGVQRVRRGELPSYQRISRHDL